MVVVTSNMNESAVGFCCNTVNVLFPVIISKNVTEVVLELENKIIHIYLSQKNVLTKINKKQKTNERNNHDRLYFNTETTRKKIKI